MPVNLLRYARGVQVFLVRHADAAPESQLTALGRRQAHALGERMRWHDCVPTVVWSSPLVRAVQTAELVCGVMSCKATIDRVAGLAPAGSPAEVVATIRALASTSAVMLVGHEPSLSSIGALLVGDPKFAGLARAEAVRILDGTVRWRFAWDAEAPNR